MGDALQLLGLMKKANALVTGEDNTGESVHSKKSRLVLFAADASDNAIRRANGYVQQTRIPVVQLPYTKEELGTQLGTGLVSMMSITDIGFAVSFMKQLSISDAERYEAVFQMILEKKMQMDARKQKKPAKVCNGNKTRRT